MSILLKTHKLLWGRSGNKCAIPDCRHDLIADETETDDEAIIGDEAHIVARSLDGPRGVSDLTPEQRDQYDNLILLCRKHHKVIDDQPNFYTVQKLKEIKAQHEEWIKNSLITDQETEKNELIYASYIDKLTNMFDFDNWNTWTSSLLSFGQPSIQYVKLLELKEIPNYVVSRFWPNKYDELEAAIFNLKNILNDLLKVFDEYAETEAEITSDEEEYKIIHTRKFYQIDRWDTKLYHKLLDQYEYHVDLVQDLVLELTRGANFTIEKTRKYINPKYRENEGKLLITSGPSMDSGWRTFKVEYKPEEKKDIKPYHGLKSFMSERETRDSNFGEGVNTNYLPERFFS